MDIKETLGVKCKIYKKQLTVASETSKEIQRDLIGYYTEELIKSFKSWDDLLCDINWICDDGGVGKLLAIKLIKDIYHNRLG